ncbi:molybdate ABC transporter substrate-binding protein [Kribbella sandramycini]|uniref:Molybdate-binding protein ModA n=1 Tax=Kribbella sandramycini TaxID=60450 RepID=A0A7Y4L0E0_9ACTN|nr:molybdate ABC transporter substrate-binding protein [Kribbella sandramycini]MBB6564990.1 molybdate transport system substrate-binding protein [Kribbella sandramycini]NOL41262.1 molybdate ABC transporter substrate-binding protein [Kribbella sandramycini]
MFRRTALATLAAVATLTLVSCGNDQPAASNNPSTPTLSGTVTVFAAASLTGSFTQLGKDFEAANPGAKVVFNFAGSSALAQQINQGAPADVFASAAPKNMDQVTDKGTPTTFAQNTLEIAVPKGNPGNITGLKDFTDQNKKIALCAAQVPCGAAAEKVFKAVSLTPQPDSLEQDVKAALTKVSLGEVDAALVYKTDVLAAKDKVDGIEFPEADMAINEYPIATLTKGANAAGAKAFVDYVLSDKGKAVLTAAGFAAP